MFMAQTQPGFKHFDKFNFVESFIATVSDPKVKEEEKKRAIIIAEAIEEAQTTMLENVATKQDLQLMKYQLIGAVATLIVFLPPFVEVVKRMLGA
jgi:hypothetical protein